MKGIAGLALIAGLMVASFGVRPALADEDAAPKAEDGHHHHGHWDKARADRFKEKLGLTDEQAGKLKQAREAGRKAVEPLRKELKTAMRKLHGELEIGAAEADVTAALDGVEKAKAAVKAEREKDKAAFEAVLTPIQRAKLVVMRDRMMRRHRMMAMHRGRRCEGFEGRKGPRGHRHGDKDGKDGKGEQGGPASEE